MCYRKTENKEIEKKKNSEEKLKMGPIPLKALVTDTNTHRVASLLKQIDFLDHGKKTK